MPPSSDSPHGAVERLLPHRRTARLLTSISTSGADFLEATGYVPAAHPLVRDGRAPCFLGLELGAQAAAALEAYLRSTTTADLAHRIGYLVRVREASFREPDLPVETPLFVAAHLEGAALPVFIYRIRVGVGRIEYLQAVLSTHSGTGSGPSEDFPKARAAM